MTYQPACIKVNKLGRFAYTAYVLYQDDGLSTNEDSFRFAGPDIIEGPFDGFTHKGAWRKAWKAAGRKLVGRNYVD